MHFIETALHVGGGTAAGALQAHSAHSRGQFSAARCETVAGRTFAPAIPCVPRGSANPEAGAPTAQNLAGQLGHVRKQTGSRGNEIKEMECSRPTRKLATAKLGDKSTRYVVIPVVPGIHSLSGILTEPWRQRGDRCCDPALPGHRGQPLRPGHQLKWWDSRVGRGAGGLAGGSVGGSVVFSLRGVGPTVWSDCTGTCAVPAPSSPGAPPQVSPVRAPSPAPQLLHCMCHVLPGKSKHASPFREALADLGDLVRHWQQAEGPRKLNYRRGATGPGLRPSVAAHGPCV